MNTRNIKFVIISVISLLIIITSYIQLNKNAKNVVILGYHHFVTKDEKEEFFAENEYVIDVEKFEEQLKYLQEKKYNSINIDELYCWLNKKCKLPKKSVLITIDDGNLSTYKYALPLLEKYNYSGAAFIITSRVKPESPKWEEGKFVYMGENTLADVINNYDNLALGSHSHNLHRQIDNKSPKDALNIHEIEEDLMISKEIVSTDIFAYPFGSFNDKYINALKNQGFKMAFTYGPFRSANQKDDLFLIPRIEVTASTSIEEFKSLLKK